MEYKCRIELSRDEIVALKILLENSEMQEDIKKILLEKISNPTIIHHSEKKVNATKKATATRTAKAKEKIQNAINLLRLENKEMTIYNISKIAGVSFQTVQKYLSNDDIKSLNQN